MKELFTAIAADRTASSKSAPRNQNKGEARGRGIMKFVNRKIVEESV